MGVRPNVPRTKTAGRLRYGLPGLYAGAAMNITANEKAFAHRGLTGYEDDSVRQLAAGQQHGVVRLKLVKEGIT